MQTDLRQITGAIAAALGDGWRCEPGQYDHYCYLVASSEVGDGLTLWVRLDADKPGRLVIRCDAPDAADIYGHRLTYSSDYVPRISVAATRTPASIAADIRSRLLPEAQPWYANALVWKAKCDRDAAFVEEMRRQLLALQGACRGSDNRKVYGPGWECETFTDSAGLLFRRLSYEQAVALLHEFVSLHEKEAVALSNPVQSSMFPDGDDLPMFTLTESHP